MLDKSTAAPNHAHRFPPVQSFTVHRPVCRSLMAFLVAQIRSSRRVLHIVLASALVIFVSWGLLATNPLQAVNGTSFQFVRLIDDFLIHLCVYATLTLALMPIVSQQRLVIQRLVIGLIVAHSVATELLQIMIPLRTCDPVDLMANWLGIALGVRLTAHVPQALSMLLQFFIAQRADAEQPSQQI